MSCVVYSRIKKAVSFHGAKALDDIGFAPMGAVDQFYGCAPQLNTPLVEICDMQQDLKGQNVKGQGHEAHY